ncbi:MAG: hypothetical protein M1819_001883 [Sarea resinae]|nr:MAG: hypothetical protein M1819_001883 [Sarea resinae]
MDPQEVQTYVKELQKATAAGESAANITVLLENLKKNVVATEDLLRHTRVGVVVNRSKQHKDPAVARLATEIVSKWKHDVSKTKSSKSSPARQVNVASSPGSSGTTKVNSQANSQPSVPPNKRDHQTDCINLKFTGNPSRNRSLGLLYNGLVTNSPLPGSVVFEKAKEVEAVAFATLGPETTDKYKNKIRSLFQNLRNKSNPGLRTRILDNEISAERFVEMTHEELKSDQRRAEDAQFEKQNMSEAMVAQAERSISASLTCGKCGQKKVSYSQAQTRSADEPMTTFCDCTNCGHRWKFS